MAQAASAINARFGTEFTRNAAIGRAKRLGLADRLGAQGSSKAAASGSLGRIGAETPRKHAPQKVVRPIAAAAPAPALEPVKPVKLRCVGVKPRLLAFADLEPGDCRYPYGGDKDGEAYAFCGHPRIPHSSYCAAASRADPRSGNRVRTHGRSGHAQAGQGRLISRPHSIAFISQRGDKMPRIKRKSSRVGKIHDRRSRDLPLNAEVVAVEVDDPMALEPGDKIVALRSVRGDPLGWLHSHHQIDDAQYRGGRAFQNDWERAERGPQAVDPDPRICRRRAAARTDHRGPAQRRAAPQSRRARARRRRIGAGP